MDELHPVGEDRRVRPFFDVVRHHDDRLRAFAAHLVCDGGYAQSAVDRLAAGHCHRIVVQNFIGDIDLRRDRLTDSQRAGMKIGAVAEILEHVLGFGERRLPAPGRTFATHLGEGLGTTVHPGDHVVATDAAERARAFRHRGRGVVRTARAIMRGAWKIGARQRQFLFLGGDPLQPIRNRLAGEKTREAFCDHARDARRRQLVRGWQDPFVGFVVFADNAWARVTAMIRIRPVVHRLFHLRFDERALLLDHDDVFQTCREVADADRLERPGHADFIYTYTDIRGGTRVDAEIFQRLQHVEIALAGGDDAEPRLRRIDHRAVDAVGARERDRGLDRVLVQAHFLIQRRVGPADVQSARRQIEIARNHDIELVRIDADAGRGFHGFSDCLETDPAPGEARHGPAEQP